MSSKAIILNNVSKCYRLYENPVQRVKETFHPFRKKYSTSFHALKNITTEIDRGETVGIVGRNGCGKSTLLQIICGIMPPTSGSLHVDGRISAILELGSGFNPEFSGRDNIYQNCSIIGIDRSKVDERIDSILDFADIGRFIDQPVKTFSSGMVMRLAFAIAINVDPAILVVDEALAVGDSAFQRKCFSRIMAIKKLGATILFVSHDAGAVVDLCDRAILLDQGEMLFSGSPKNVIALYHKLLFAPHDKVHLVRKSIIDGMALNDNPAITSPREITPEISGKKSKPFLNIHLVPKSTTWYEPDGAVIFDPHIQTLSGEKVNMLVRNKEYFFKYNVQFEQDVFDVRFGMLIKTKRGVELGGYGKRVEGEFVEYIPKGSVAKVLLRFRCALLPGAYFLNAGVVGVKRKVEGFLHRGIDVCMFEVMQEENLGSTAIVDFGIIPNVQIENQSEN